MHANSQCCVNKADVILARLSVSKILVCNLRLKKIKAWHPIKAVNLRSVDGYDSSFYGRSWWCHIGKTITPNLTACLGKKTKTKDRRWKALTFLKRSRCLWDNVLPTSSLVLWNSKSHSLATNKQWSDSFDSPAIKVSRIIFLLDLITVIIRV